jgi:heme-degrading monooxygenase HmoA
VVGIRYGAPVSVVRINAITVPEGGGEELARRFAARAGAVDRAEGFEGFELLRPTDGRSTWLVVTRWRDEESFAAWVSSSAFAHGHAGVAAQGAAPVATSSELWSYEVVVASPARQAGAEA